eukprot:CAMPEP_0179369306 /NCGR_PEP_ID=MMETSP0797-20121207/84551_1 /TAXON_ID=47934 /ORGANISM="Dinophysis acuminata, Strain DAEP01" /LENGTH=169 /DNA_ID=CAMNT_0021084941 /DNA_START=298 /DNA_END=804 /DNA_ORIENTATION=+
MRAHCEPTPRRARSAVFHLVQLPPHGNVEEQQEEERDAHELHQLAQDARVVGGLHHLHAPVPHEGEEAGHLGRNPTRVLELQQRDEGAPRDREVRDPVEPVRELRVEAVGEHEELRHQVRDHRVQHVVRDDEAEEEPDGPHGEDVQAEDQVHLEDRGHVPAEVREGVRG